MPSTVSTTVSISGIPSGTKTYSVTQTASGVVDSTTPVALTANSATSVTPPASSSFAILIFGAGGGPFNFGAVTGNPQTPASSTITLPLATVSAFSIFNNHATNAGTVEIIWM